MLEAVARRVRGSLGLRGGGPSILLYHRVAESPPDPFGLCVSPRHFGEHLEILARDYRPMPLDALVAAARAGGGATNAVALTFDDGYADNLSDALPLLSRFGIPATFLVVTGQIGARRGFWWDELERIILRTSTLPDTLALGIAGETREWHSTGDSMPRRRHLFHDLYAILITLPRTSRETLQDELLRWAGAAPEAPAGDRALAAEEIAALARNGLATIGAHTVSHPPLPALPEDEQLREMRESRNALEDLVGRPVRSFAYPYGEHDDRSVACARAAGFDMALTCVAAPVSARTNPMRLPRVEVHDCDGEDFGRSLHRRRFTLETA